MDKDKLVELAERCERGERTGFVNVLNVKVWQFQRMDNGQIVAIGRGGTSEPIYRSTPLLREVAAALRSHARIKND